MEENCHTTFKLTVSHSPRVITIQSECATNSLVVRQSEWKGNEYGIGKRRRGETASYAMPQCPTRTTAGKRCHRCHSTGWRGRVLRPCIRALALSQTCRGSARPRGCLVLGLCTGGATLCNLIRKPVSLETNEERGDE